MYNPGFSFYNPGHSFCVLKWFFLIAISNFIFITVYLMKLVSFPANYKVGILGFLCPIRIECYPVHNFSILGCGLIFSQLRLQASQQPVLTSSSSTVVSSTHKFLCVRWGSERRRGMLMAEVDNLRSFPFCGNRLDYSVKAYSTQVNLFLCKNDCSCECPLLNAAGV